MISHIVVDLKVEKRPILHAPIASARAGRSQQKVIYVSSKTPFMSAFKRLVHLLYHVDKRNIQSSLSRQRRVHGKLLTVDPSKPDENEEVILKATGKAIEKALSLALFIQSKDAYSVIIRTSTVEAIDDVVPRYSEQEFVKEEQSTDLDLSDTRLRHASSVEIAVTLK